MRSLKVVEREGVQTPALICLRGEKGLKPRGKKSKRW